MCHMNRNAVGVAQEKASGITFAIRSDLTPMPKKMIEAGLPIDHRGYPVPWFVPWVFINRKTNELVPDSVAEAATAADPRDGMNQFKYVPEFRAMDPGKMHTAITRKKCWVCGGRLGVNMVFVAGPMCGVSRTSSEPPSHYECAKWSAINCPFLSRPQMHRREDQVLNDITLKSSAAGIAITRNPGVSMLWKTNSYTTFRPDPSKPATVTNILFRMGECISIEWLTAGRPSTRDEVLHSITTGMPELEHVAWEQDQDEGTGTLCMDLLHKQRDVFISNQCKASYFNKLAC